MGRGADNSRRKMEFERKDIEFAIQIRERDFQTKEGKLRLENQQLRTENHRLRQGEEQVKQWMTAFLAQHPPSVVSAPHEGGHVNPYELSEWREACGLRLKG